MQWVPENSKIWTKCEAEADFYQLGFWECTVFFWLGMRAHGICECFSDRALSALLCSCRLLWFEGSICGVSWRCGFWVLRFCVLRWVTRGEEWCCAWEEEVEARWYPHCWKCANEIECWNPCFLLPGNRSYFFFFNCMCMSFSLRNWERRTMNFEFSLVCLLGFG